MDQKMKGEGKEMIETWTVMHDGEEQQPVKWLFPLC